MAQSKPLSEFSILVCGRTGVGKSSLVNFIVGEDVCDVGDPAVVDEEAADTAFDQKTSKVSKQKIIMNNVGVTIYDSPGLQDGTADEPMYLADMLENCRDVDLVFYCHEMIASRWTPPEVRSVRLLTETFGSTFWDKAILVLTKANMVQPTQQLTDEELKKYFLQLKVNKEKKFRLEIAKQVHEYQRTPKADEQPSCGSAAGSETAKEHPKQIDSLPGVPSGSETAKEHPKQIDSHPAVSAGSETSKEHPKQIDSLPAIPTGSKSKQFLPDGKHFIGNLWVTCMERLPPDQVESFMQATGSANRIVSCEDIKGGKSPGFIPSREDLLKAWESMTVSRVPAEDDKPLR